MKVHTAIVLDKRRQHKDGTYPIRLRITQKGQRRYYSISHERRKGVNFNVTEEEWNRVKGDSPRGRYRDIKLLIPELVKEADDIAASLDPFTFDSFSKAYNAEKSDNGVYDVFQEYISELESKGRVSTADSYRCAMNSLKKYDPDATFDSIDATWLESYESWFVGQTKDKDGRTKKSGTTVGIYTRSLRAIFNLAIDKGFTKNYPFGKKAYTPPSGKNIKKALELDDIKKIVDYSPDHKSPTDQARDLWVFSYFSGGMNIKDICSIRVKDIQGDLETIEFVREKTRLSRRGSQRKIEVLIVPETKAILEKWGKTDGDPEDYVFPFFKRDYTPAQKRATVMQLVKTTNKYLRRMAKELDLPIDITTYHARHSYASILKESGAPIEYISESLGHTSTQTTEAYLKSFSRAHREKWADALRGRSTDEGESGTAS